MGFRQDRFGVLLVLMFGVCNAQFPRTFPQMDNLVGPQSPRIQQTAASSVVPRPLGLMSGSLGAVQNQQYVQSQQMFQGPVKKLTWHYPQAPVIPTQPEVHFEMRQPVHAQSVAAECGESLVYVEVKKDLFGIGGVINPADLTLGDCTASGEDPAAQVFIFQSELHMCRSVFTMTEDEMVYTFNLKYNPKIVTDSPVVRMNNAMISIECHYPRKHNVSSNAIMPTWIPYAAAVQAEERLVFSLKLMMDDWQFERPSNQYFLGDLVNIEASVIQYNHVPLRVFVDSCVATATPDRSATSVYAFIQNYGCLADAKLTGSRSRFMPRVQGDKLQFQLETFQFKQQDSGLIYITCFLKAVAASAPTDAVHKACSFTANGWTAVDQGQVCGCCDTVCSPGAGGSAPVTGPHWEGDVSLGPVSVKQRFVPQQ